MLESAVALGSVQAATSFYGAMEQNRAVKKSLESASVAAGAQIGQTRDAALLETTKAKRQAAQTAGRLRVLAAASGRGEDFSIANSLDQATADEATNVTIIDRNRDNSVRSIRSNLAATEARLRAGYQNPILAGISSILQGAQTAIGTYAGLKAIAGPGGGGGGGGNDNWAGVNPDTGFEGQNPWSAAH